MTIEELLALEDKGKMIDQLTRDTKENRERENYRNEYKGSRTRRGTSVDNREDKEVDVYSDTEEDEGGNPVKTGTKPVKATKLHTNIPKRIVRTSTAFLFGGDMMISFAAENEASQLFREVVTSKLKLASVLNKFARTVKIETKSAIQFYPAITMGVDNKPVTEIRVKVLSLKNGDFFPHFDEYENMDAFTRKYKAIHTDGQERDFIWIQTATKEITYFSNGGNWEELNNKPNLAGKITVVYAEQDAPEWEDEAATIDALENRISRLIDTNDYFSEPILKAYGETSLPSKSTVGKQITFPLEIDQETGKSFHGDADYLVWQQSVESIKLEIEALKNEIYSGTSTPDLSFENIRGLGTLSGIAIKLMFMDAYIKAAEDMEIFAPAVTRCVNILIAMIGRISNVKYNDQIIKARPSIKFGSILPENMVELVETLVKASGDKAINAQKTILSNSPFTKNAEEEWRQLQDEESEKTKNLNLSGLSV